jgi:CRP-like cAMP-binding protein
MYLKQGDLFWGMGKEFVQEAMQAAEKIDRHDGDYLFMGGDAASHFYILVKGRVKLSIGETGPVVYMARHPGEIIGWSSIIGRDLYSATAQCVEPTHLVKVEKKKFLESLEKDADNERILYKRLAEMLGNRLIELYPNVV